MTRIIVSKRIEATVAHTKQYLRAYIENRRGADGAVTLPMRVSLSKLAETDLTLVHDVVVRVSNGKDPSGLNRTLLVEWHPVGDGPFPTFRGMLNVLGEEDADVSHLEIDGTYEAPAAEFGKLFDVVIGSRIAQASLDDLLERLAQEIEVPLSA